jgi:ATP-binding cassette subfamily F protein uup
LAELPAKLEALEAEQVALAAEIADPVFYTRDRNEVAAKLARLPTLEAELEFAFKRWAELEGG